MPARAPSRHQDGRGPCCGAFGLETATPYDGALGRRVDGHRGLASPLAAYFSSCCHRGAPFNEWTRPRWATSTSPCLTSRATGAILRACLCFPRVPALAVDSQTRSTFRGWKVLLDIGEAGAYDGVVFEDTLALLPHQRWKGLLLLSGLSPLPSPFSFGQRPETSRHSSPLTLYCTCSRNHERCPHHPRLRRGFFIRNGP